MIPGRQLLSQHMVTPRALRRETLERSTADEKSRVAGPSLTAAGVSFSSRSLTQSLTAVAAAVAAHRRLPLTLPPLLSLPLILG